MNWLLINSDINRKAFKHLQAKKKQEQKNFYIIFFTIMHKRGLNSTLGYFYSSIQQNSR